MTKNNINQHLITANEMNEEDFPYFNSDKERLKYMRNAYKNVVLFFWNKLDVVQFVYDTYYERLFHSHIASCMYGFICCNARSVFVVHNNKETKGKINSKQFPYHKERNNARKKHINLDTN